MLLSQIEWTGLPDFFLDALLDSAIILPILFFTHVLMAVVDRFAGKKTQKGLKGPFAPLIGAAAGCLPQCGFSVAGARLYSKKYISLGALVAVFISTSDEAVLILLSSSESAKKLLPLLAIKLVYALIAGYTLSLIVFLLEKNKKKRLYQIGGESVIPLQKTEPNLDNTTVLSNTSALNTTPVLNKTDVLSNTSTLNNAEDSASCGEGETDHNHNCCCCDKSEKQNKGAWHVFALHPLFHTLKIFAYVLAVNIVLGLIIFFVTPERFEAFVSNLTVWQPVLAALVGLIPNCAATVVLAEMYAEGMLTLGAAVAGLSAAAGLGYAVLIKEHKNKLNVVLIIVGMWVFASIAGMIVDLIF